MIFSPIRKKGGFTGLELVVVVAVILILAGTMLAFLFPLITKARFARQEMELREFATAFARLYGDVAYLPPNNNAIDSDPGLWSYGTAPYANPASATIAANATNIAGAWYGPYLLRSWPQTTPFGNYDNGTADGYAYGYGTTVNAAPYGSWDFDTITDNTGAIRGLYHSPNIEVLTYVEENLDDGSGGNGYFVHDGAVNFAFFIGEGPDWQ